MKIQGGNYIPVRFANRNLLLGSFSFGKIELVFVNSYKL